MWNIHVGCAATTSEQTERTELNKSTTEKWRRRCRSDCQRCSNLFFCFFLMNARVSQCVSVSVCRCVGVSVSACVCVCTGKRRLMVYGQTVESSGHRCASDRPPSYTRRQPKFKSIFPLSFSHRTEFTFIITSIRASHLISVATYRQKICKT